MEGFAVIECPLVRFSTLDHANTGKVSSSRKKHRKTSEKCAHTETGAGEIAPEAGFPPDGFLKSPALQGWHLRTAPESRSRSQRGEAHEDISGGCIGGKLVECEGFGRKVAGKAPKGASWDRGGEENPFWEGSIGREAKNFP